MINNNILLIPLDDRPCNYDFPIKLAKIADCNLIIPDKNLLGNIFRVGNRKKIYKFIESNFKICSSVIISFDTLLYGGLVPSRRNYDTFEEIKSFLSIINEIKNYNKKIKIYANTTIMRISNNNYNEEEKEYWKDYGKEIYKLSYFLHKNKIINQNNYENFSIEEYSDKIPRKIINDYFKGRLKNFFINKEIINLAINKKIDFLSISCDDSGKYGFNVLEKKILKEYCKNFKNIIIYPGADEALLILLTRFINHKGKIKPKFFTLFDCRTKKDKTITIYEGVSIKNTLKSQLKVIGGKIVNDINKCDIVLYFHLLNKSQEDQYLNSIYKKKSYELSTKFIKNEIENIENITKLKDLAIVDIAYANGADKKFTECLLKKINPLNFISYSAWNTAGNTIGTIISHSSIAKFNNKNKLINLEFLIERFLDDYLYQSKLRLEYAKKYLYPISESKLEELKSYFIKESNKFIDNISKNNKLKIKIKKVEFPWNRLFEINVQVIVQYSKKQI
ncbi:MAG: hypothetical protein KatS3mg068_1654 [Candidatus Sericytochromatia bacterium]|nr:MAG: hypothetical protein KatS3mg068_1654 [Candidatus Sericytochromatia bacterium]